KLPTYFNRLDLLTAEGPIGVARMLFEQLLKQNLQYDTEPFDPKIDKEQLLRKPATIQSECRGTCIDLALLFATTCLDSQLLPVVVIVNGHAFTGISRKRWKQNLGQRPKDLQWEQGELKVLQTLRDLTDVEYAWIECTGMAASQSLSAKFPEGRGRD